MTETVLIVAEEPDAHAEIVAERVAQLGGETVVFDTASFPTAGSLSVRYGDEDGFALTTDDWQVDETELAGVWWRRTNPYEPSPAIEDDRVRNFVRQESRHAFHGWLHTLGDRVVNPITADRRAARKPYQLALAESVGLTVPETLVTNEPEEVERFRSANDGTVFKVLQAPSWRMAETRRLTDEAMERLDRVADAPVIFQAEIDKADELRVTVIGDEVFPATVEPRPEGAQLDWRLDPHAPVDSYDLPERVGERLIALLDRLGLHMGVFDLAVTPDGEYVFFEVNPQGQWLFVELRTGQRISEALAATLLSAE